ncbi:MAG: T9SS type A sorting domain-containing protein [Bacteroidales bacterium]|nr:T9SS type A sorting domain-containing protein [Bacteroidales bacterium]
MKFKSLFLMVVLFTWLGKAFSGTEPILLNPLSSPFYMEDGEFLGTLGVMCGESGTVAITTDEGLTWSLKHLAPYVTLKQVIIEDANTFWLLSDSLLYKSTDGGNTFDILYSAATGEKLIRLRIEGTQAWLLSSTDSPLQQSIITKNNTDWSTTPQTIALSFYPALDFELTGTDVALVITNGAVYKTVDGGLSFSLMYTISEYESFSTIRKKDNNVVFIGGMSYGGKKTGQGRVDSWSVIWKTVNGGITWSQKSLGSDLTYSSQPNKISTLNSGIVLVGLSQLGEEGSLWPAVISFDDGVSWSGFITDSAFNMANFEVLKKAWVMASANYFWTYEQKIMHTLFYSGTYLNLATHDPLVVRRINDIANPGMFSSLNKTFLSVGFYYDQLLVSEDFGVSWNSAAIAEDSFLDRIAFSSDGLHGMVTATHRTYSTSNGGNTWTKHSHFDPQWPSIVSLSYPVPSVAYRLVSDYIDPDIYYLQKSVNEGASWTYLQLPGENIKVMKFTSASRGYLFGGDNQTGSGGFYLTTDGAATWTWYPLAIDEIILADVPYDSLAYVVTSDNKFYKLLIGSTGVSVEEIAIPLGITLTGFDFSDALHGVLLGEDEWFTHVYWTNSGGAAWNECATWLPKGLNQVKLINNFLNGYVLGRDNILVMLDDAMPLSHEENNAAKLSVYPNPTNRYLIFDAGIKSARIEIYNETGLRVMSSEVDLPTRIPVQQLKKGLYFYRITFDNQSYTGKFLKID